MVNINKPVNNTDATVSTLGLGSVKVLDNNEEGEKKIFQLSKNSLISIDSKKMIGDITQMLIDSNDIVDKPRKIKENESISDYLKYLDDYFKTRIVTIM